MAKKDDWESRVSDHSTVAILLLSGACLLSVVRAKMAKLARQLPDQEQELMQAVDAMLNESLEKIVELSRRYGPEGDEVAQIYTNLMNKLADD